jgi:hypothetical protein
VRWKLTKKQKLFIPVFLFRRRVDDGSPPSSPEYEIETEGGGYYFITEGSSSSLPTYIITE